MSLLDFISRYFIQPIYTGEGYNVYNTLVYGLALGIGILLVERLLLKLKIKVDSRFFIALLPFLIFASTSRSLVDASIFPRTAFLITPGIFITTTFLAAFSLLISLRLQKLGPEFHKTMFALGSLFALYPLYKVFTSISYWMPFLQIAVLLPVSILIFIYAFERLGYSQLKNPWIKAVFAGHLLDATATVVGVEYYGYFEEHVFEDWLINLVGTAYILYPLKLVVLIIIIYIINSVVEEENRNFWYLAFFILGFAPGLRDSFTIMLLG